MTQYAAKKALEFGAKVVTLSDSDGFIYDKDGLRGRIREYAEKEIGKGNFHDQNLGKTMYSLGRVHAALGSVSKAERYCALGAKCGYGPAKDFCDKYKIKY